MVSLTEIERKALLMLFKEYTIFYNAHTISKVLGISHVGAQKIFKRLSKEEIVVSKTIGKSIIYKVRLGEDYVDNLMGFLLSDEAQHFKRWKEEFKGLFKSDRIVIMYGSAIKNFAHAHDIDLMIIMRKEESKEVISTLKERGSILPKPLHALKLTHEDLLTNLKKRDKIFLDIIKHSVVLYGQNQFVEVIKHVNAGF